MEALIFILGMVVLVESAAIVVLWNESSARKREIKKLIKHLQNADMENFKMGENIKEMSRVIRQYQKHYLAN